MKTSFFAAFSMSAWMTAAASAGTLYSSNIEASDGFTNAAAVNGVAGWTGAPGMVFATSASTLSSGTFGVTPGGFRSGSTNTDLVSHALTTNAAAGENLLTVEFTATLRIATGFVTRLDLVDANGLAPLSIGVDQALQLAPVFGPQVNFGPTPGAALEDRFSNTEHRTCDIVVTYDQRSRLGKVTARNLAGDGLTSDLGIFTAVVDIATLRTVRISSSDPADTILALAVRTSTSPAVVRREFEGQEFDAFPTDVTSPGAVLPNGTVEGLVSRAQGINVPGLDFRTTWTDLVTNDNIGGPGISSFGQGYQGGVSGQVQDGFPFQRDPEYSPDGGSFQAGKEKRCDLGPEVDGKLTLTFDPVNVTGKTGVQMRLFYWVSFAEFWDADDAFVVTLKDADTTAVVTNLVGPALFNAVVTPLTAGDKWIPVVADFAALGLTGNVTLSISVSSRHIAGGTINFDFHEYIYVDGISFTEQVPGIAEFVSSAPGATPGQPVTLSWHVVGATSVTLQPGGATLPASGSLVVSPGQPTVYKLTATLPSGATETREISIEGGIPHEANFRFYRFSQMTLREPLINMGSGAVAGNFMQLAEFRLGYRGALTTGGVASSPDGASPAGNEPDKCLDGDATTKWISRQNTPLVITFPAATLIDSYAFTTGDDFPGRDPQGWVLEGSANGTTWTQLDTRAKYPTPSARYAATPWLYLGELGGLRITDIRFLANDRVQLTWPSSAGSKYAIFRSVESLNLKDWRRLQSNFIADGAIYRAIVPSFGRSGSYRVVKE